MQRTDFLIFDDAFYGINVPSTPPLTFMATTVSISGNPSPLLGKECSSHWDHHLYNMMMTKENCIVISKKRLQ